VEAILGQLRTGKVTMGAAGRGVIAGVDSDRIETPYLQLVMTRLWDEESQGTAAPGLRLSTLERLGGAERIVRTHLDTTMETLPSEEQETAARIFRYLVTPSGTKIAHTATDLAEYAHVSMALIEPILEKLSGTGIRILRPVAPPINQPGLPRYEIFHDVLAGAITDWRTRYVRARELAEADQRRAEAEKLLDEEKHKGRRLRWGVIGLSMMVLLMIGRLCGPFYRPLFPPGIDFNRKPEGRKLFARRRYGFPPCPCSKLLKIFFIKGNHFFWRDLFKFNSRGSSAIA
jgi:hypothetical protein